MYDFVDIHSHLHFKQYDDDRNEAVERLRAAGGATIAIGTDERTSLEVIALAQAHENVYACVGVYPVDIHEREHEVAALARMLEDESLAKEIVAIGECGLDYAGNPSGADKAAQKTQFEAQIDVAERFERPLMIHCREAYEDTAEILERRIKASEGKLRVHMHFFAGDLATAKRFVEMGCTLSFTGVITFASQYDEVVKWVPLDRIMAETDAPYVTPVPHRGKRNEPVFVTEVIKRIAELKGIPEEDCKMALRENVRTVFGI